MAQMTPQVSELLEKALNLSTKERVCSSIVWSRVWMTSLLKKASKPAWDEEIKRRVDDIRSGRVKTIPGEEVLRRLKTRLRNARG